MSDNSLRAIWTRLQVMNRDLVDAADGDPARGADLMKAKDHVEIAMSYVEMTMKRKL